MTIKQFLKPDWRKIKVFVILLLINNLLPYIPVKICYFGWKGRFGCNWILRQPIFIFDFTTESTQYYLGLENILLGLILGLFFMFCIPYLLSCFLVWVFDKVKKKK